MGELGQFLPNPLISIRNYCVFILSRVMISTINETISFRIEKEVKPMKGNRYLIALVAALGLIPIVLDTTIVTVALTPIRNDLHTDVNTVQWIVTGFFLANSAVIAVGGYLANRFGRRRMFLVGITVFTLGSVLCAVSPGIGWLITFRVL